MIVFHALDAGSVDLFLKFCEENKIAVIFREDRPYAGYGHGPMTLTWHAATATQAFFLSLSYSTERLPYLPKDFTEACDKISETVKRLGIRVVKGRMAVDSSIRTEVLTERR